MKNEPTQKDLYIVLQKFTTLSNASHYLFCIKMLFHVLFSTKKKKYKLI